MMSFRVAVALAAVASVVSFAPLNSKVPINSMKMSSMENLPGITGPLGFFDPLGLSSKLSDTDVSKFREAEIKVISIVFLIQT